MSSRGISIKPTERCPVARGRMASQFQAISIRVAHEGGVTVGVVLRSLSTRAVFRPAGRQRGLVEPIDRVPIGSAECEKRLRGFGRAFRRFMDAEAV